MHACALTDIGRKRQSNQDVVFCSENPLGNLPNLFAVADGMGGHKAGDYASRTAVEILLDHVKNTDSGTEEELDKTSDSGENDPLAIHSIIIGDTEASILHDTTDGADDYIIKAALPVDFSFEKTTLNLELADGAVVSDKSNCLINDLGGRPVVNLTVENASLVIANDGETRTYQFQLDIQ